MDTSGNDFIVALTISEVFFILRCSFLSGGGRERSIRDGVDGSSAVVSFLMCLPSSIEYSDRGLRSSSADLYLHRARS